MLTACVAANQSHELIGKVRVTVLGDGTVGPVEIISISNPAKRDKLEESVIKIRRWKFKPTGQSSSRVLPIVWSQKGSKPPQ